MIKRGPWGIVDRKISLSEYRGVRGSHFRKTSEKGGLSPGRPDTLSCAGGNTKDVKWFYGEKNVGDLLGIQEADLQKRGHKKTLSKSERRQSGEEGEREIWGNRSTNGAVVGLTTDTGAAAASSL